MFLGCFASCAYIYYRNLEQGISQPQRQPYREAGPSQFDRNIHMNIEEAFDSLLPEVERAIESAFDDIFSNPEDEVDEEED